MGNTALENELSTDPTFGDKMAPLDQCIASAATHLLAVQKIGRGFLSSLLS